MDGGILLPISVQDNASGKLEKIANKGKKAKKALEGGTVSDKWEKLCNSLSKTENNLNKLGIKVPQVFSKFKEGAVEGIKYLMDMSDEATKLQGKLALALDNGSSVNAFRTQIKQAADEARMSYDTMAQSIAGIGMVTNDSFSDEELVQFTKSLGMLYNLGGVDQAQIAGSLTQIKQALSSGRLQGDEFASLRDLPGFLQIIADEMGVTAGEVKSLASEGKITADVLKNAMINAGDDLQKKLNEIPETFDSRMNRINNSIKMLTDNFGLVINKIANCKVAIVIFESIKNAIDNVNKILTALGNAVSKLFGKIFKKGADDAEVMEKAIKGLSMVITGLLLVGLFLLIKAFVVLGVQALAAGIKMLIAGLMAMSPLAWIILIIIVIIGVLMALGVSFEQIFGFIGGVVGVTIAGIWNLFLALFDFVLGIINYLGRYFMTFANFFGNLFNDPIAAIIYGIRDMANTILSVVKTVAKALDKVFGSNLAGGVQGWMDSVDSLADKAAKKFGNGSYEGTEWEDLSSEGFGLKRMEYGSAWDSGVKIGSDIGAGLDNILNGDLLGGLDSTDLFGKGNENELSDYDAATGKGSLSTSLDEDSVDELKAFAEIQYRLNYKHITPNVNITFGDVRETADLDDITAHIKKMMNEDLEELYIMDGGQ